MKYIMFRCTSYDGSKIEIPIIFPKMLVHRLVAGQLASMLRNQHNYEEVKVVSAGETNIHCFSCSGKSESLEVEARPQDREMIDQHEFHNGILDDQPKKRKK
jgi:hypothetical protein